MKYPFDLDNFESFLSEQADQHRMYASDSVWRNIQEKLHGKDRWPALTFASLLTASVIAIVLTFTFPNKNLFEIPANYSAISNKANLNESISEKNDTKLIDNQTNSFKSATTTLSISPMILAVAANEATKKDGLSISSEVFSKEITESSNPETESLSINESEKNDFENSALISGAEAIFNGNDATINTTHSEFLPLTSTNNSGSIAIHNENSIEPPMQEELVKKHDDLHKEAFIKHSMEYGPEKHKPLSSKPSRWALQIYATPSVSYRYLLEDKKFDENSLTGVTGPLAPYLTNSVNEFVVHKAKAGVEIGGAVLYQLTENFRVKTGLQLNYRQFGLQGYATSFQPAMLALNRGNSVDSIVTYSSISTRAGYRELELTSSFMQLAIPIGFDLKVANIKNVNFYMSASGQLTYQMASNNYILSADYKNYLKQPDLERKFNINTAVEAFASFEAGGIMWQAGPQIRYQLLPGSQNAYPIREHLVDYGFKVGIVKTIK